jgi:hypothetical protein
MRANTDICPVFAFAGSGNMKILSHILLQYVDFCLSNNSQQSVLVICPQGKYGANIRIGKSARLPRGWNMIFISRNMIFVLCDHVF